MSESNDGFEMPEIPPNKSANIDKKNEYNNAIKEEIYRQINSIRQDIERMTEYIKDRPALEKRINKDNNKITRLQEKLKELEGGRIKRKKINSKRRRKSKKRRRTRRY